MTFILKLLLGSIVFLIAFLGIQSFEQNLRTPLPNQMLEITKHQTQNDTSTTTREIEEKIETVEVKEKVVITPQIEVKTPIAPITIAEIPKTEVIEFDVINEKARSALVNILCSTKTGSLNPLSGSGVFIDSKGIILTNAHIGQYFLLPQYVECVIRTGSPAYPEYKAKLLYISSEWMNENATQINEQNPMGTGENDYALLLITERIASTDPLPLFPFLNIFFGDVTTNEYILATSYPAGFLGGSAILQNLYAVSSVTNIQEVFTFKQNTVDLFSIGGTVVSQKGSSGGAAVNKDGLLAGLIVTATFADQTADRDLRAISLNHINRSLIKETGRDLKDLLQSDLAAELQKFESEQFPTLKQNLLNVLNN